MKGHVANERSKIGLVGIGLKVVSKYITAQINRTIKRNGNKQITN